MREYISLTDEQKRRANAVELEDFLLRRGERLIPSGHDKRLASDHSVTIRGSEWYDHEIRQGGRAIDFVRMYDGCSFQEAVTKLLNGEQGQAFRPAKERKSEPPKPFALPPVHHSMRRVYAYLMKQRHIDRDIITHFARAGTLYEDAEYHNAVFVGTDEHSVPRHAPIDLLSYLTLHPENWQHHSYVACCGTSYEPVRWMLRQMETPQMVSLCLDHDRAGERGSERMADQIASEFGIPTRRLISEQKDWNEDLCAMQEHPKQGMEMKMR